MSEDAGETGASDDDRHDAAAAEETAAGRAYRDALWNSYQSDQNAFDKTVLTMSSGALGVTFAFLKDIVPLNDAVGTWLIVGAWLAWSLSIVVTVVGYSLGAKASRVALEKWDRYVDSGDRRQRPTASDHESVWVRWMRRANLSGGLLFGTGALLAVVFVGWNVAGARPKAQPEARPVELRISVEDGRPVGVSRTGEPSPVPRNVPAAATPAAR